MMSDCIYDKYEKQIKENPPLSTRQIEINDVIMDKWQKTLNVMTEIANVPCGLITKVHPKELEVFVSAETQKNPLKKTDRFELNGKVYCEMVMKRRQFMQVPNALKDSFWSVDNPSLDLGLISYLGFPLQWPDGSIFGTICLLDTRENPHSQKIQKLVEQYKMLIDGDLALLLAYMEIKTLSGLLPICSHCKKIRDESNQWNSLEKYIGEHSNAQFTHSICPQCIEKYYPDYNS